MLHVLFASRYLCWATQVGLLSTCRMALDHRNGNLLLKPFFFAFRALGFVGPPTSEIGNSPRSKTDCAITNRSLRHGKTMKSRERKWAWIL